MFAPTHINRDSPLERRTCNNTDKKKHHFIILNSRDFIQTVCYNQKESQVSSCKGVILLIMTIYNTTQFVVVEANYPFQVVSISVTR